jgi:GPH family glycoside/pentoside/hexuronide:cation symporter
VALPLSRRQKLAYGVADLGAALSYNAINFFLLFFLVNVLELRPMLAGSVLLLGRVVDAVTDPLMGALSDRTRSRWGRRMPYIWAGLLPLGASFALLWLVPAGSQTTMFVLAATLLMLHTVLYTVVQIPYMALTPALAPGYQARTELTSYRIGFGTLASLLAAAAPPLIIALFEPGLELSRTSQASWVWMGLIFAAVITLSYLVMALSVREPPLPSFAPQPQPPFWREVPSVFRSYGFTSVVLLFMTTTLGVGIVSSMLPFYLDAALRLTAEEQTLVLGVLFVSAILSLPLWTHLAARTGKRLALGVGLVGLSMATLLLVAFSPPGVSGYLMAMSVLAGIGVGAVLLFPWAMLPDVVEFDELASGHKREGLIYAIFTFGQKTAFALGVFLNGQVQEWTGYQPGAAVQSEGAIQGIVTMVGPVAAAVFLAATFWVWRFPISRERHEAARLELAERQKVQGGSRQP